MPLKIPSACGRLMKSKVDALSIEQKRDRNAVFNAMGQGVEEYVQQLLLQLVVVIPPTPGLGTTTTPGNPTGPGPVPIPLPGAVIFK